MVAGAEVPGCWVPALTPLLFPHRINDHLSIQVAIIKLWIQLMIPKVDDGNNFGVSIQEATNEKLPSSNIFIFSIE